MQPPGLFRFARLSRSWCASLALLWVLWPAASWSQPVPNADTLLLARFDTSVDADYALGTPAAGARAATVDPAAGRFGGALDLPAGASVRFAGGDGNFHPPEGTIEFWVKPHWPGDEDSSHRFFSCRMGEREYLNVNCLPGGRMGIAVAAGEGDAWSWSRADGSIADWEPNTWHHVAVAWGGGELRAYLDGEPADKAPDDARMPDKLPEALLLTEADAVIDALRISNRKMTPEDIQRSIRESLDPPYYFPSDSPWTATGTAMANERKLLGELAVPLVLGNKRYAKGFFCRPGAEVAVPLAKPYAVFEATVGVCPFAPGEATCSFEVQADGKKLFDSGPQSARQPPQPIRVPIEGAKELTLVTRAAGGAKGAPHAIWAGAVVKRQADTEVFLSTRSLEPDQVDMHGRQQTADRYSFQPSSDATFFTAMKFWEDEIDPARPPAPEQVDRPLEAFATPGEYEPVNFVVYAQESQDKLAVEVSDLRAKGSSIPKSAVDVRLVLRGLMRDLYTLPPERSTVVSRFLLPYQPIDMPAGTFREYHLIVHVPDDAKPGTYTGSIRVSSASGPSRELSVSFEVLPFRFRPLTEKAYGIYYRFPRGDADWSTVEAELADLRAHGVTTLKCDLGIEYELIDGQIVPSRESLVRGLELLKKHGFSGPLPVSTGCERIARLLGYDPVADFEDRPARDRFHAAVKEAMEGLVELRESYPEFEFLPTHMDEVFGRDRLMRYIRFTEAVRQVESLRVYITFHNDPGRDVEEMMRQCDPFVDVRSYNGHCMDNWIRAGNSFDDLARELAASGDEAWLYHNIRGSFFPAEWTRLINGYYLWISPLRVHVPWMYYSFNGNPFDATDGPRLRGGDFAYAAPHPSDPSHMVPTRHWEAFREGIDDLHYLNTLANLVDEHAETPEAAAARTWLAKLRKGVTPGTAELEPIEEESPLLVWQAAKLHGVDYRRIRRQAADHIESLQGLD